jgi:hypothetical protein
MIRKYKFPHYKVILQDDLVPRTCVALAYIHINALHYRRRRRCRHVVCLTTGSQLLPMRVLTVRSSASSLNVQYFFISMSSSSCVRLLSHLSIPFVFPSITCFRKQLLHMMWPIYLAFICFTLCRIFSFLPWLYVIYLHFLRDRSNWSPSFCRTTFQNFLGISDLLSEVSTLRLHKKLYSKCSTSLVSSLNLSLVCRR